MTPFTIHDVSADNLNLPSTLTYLQPDSNPMIMYTFNIDIRLPQ
jgi:hypothetical protein